MIQLMVFCFQDPRPQVEISRRVRVCAGSFAGLIITNGISNSKSRIKYNHRSEVLGQCFEEERSEIKLVADHKTGHRGGLTT